MPGELKPFDNDGIKRQKNRFQKIADIVDKIRSKSDNMLLIGDYNIDQWKDNEPWLWPELRALQPILDHIMVNNGLKIMNHKTARHCVNQRSSLLDLILSSDPESISNVKSIKTGLSDHDGLLCHINCKDVHIQPQFIISRDFSKMDARYIIPMIDNDVTL